MRRARGYVSIIVITLLIVVVIQFMSPSIGSNIATMLTTATTILGIFSVFIEMKRSADLAECDFIFNLHKQFEDTPKIQSLYKKLTDEMEEEKSLISEKDRQEIVSYLSFYEMLCNLILKDAIAIEDIDALFAFTFFLAVNNEKIQEIELKKYKDYYQNIYAIYSKWYKYRKDKGYKIPYEENKLI